MKTQSGQGARKGGRNEPKFEILTGSRNGKTTELGTSQSKCFVAPLTWIIIRELTPGDTSLTPCLESSNVEM